ncbi:MAG: hypothetical protein HOI56_00200 [Gammaproteobacteria bacterium]|jgi:hypothetical protein|nr:hypothetical protein [Gammaproteobacteria bacterium]MBT4462178.1 hypothetical protein [Gammaproteobacteria bacterium]MBT4655037.1 hypothetical protein [Gammaproteobacteria bacterium]MBT5116449.1 hypothetical protein [Gammaproteobacteria bacterium]MBT5761149.1 hypothetical protein [Gammaproteobacteria bacterium]
MDICNDNNYLVKSSVEFLVPFTNILINNLSVSDISFSDFKNALKKIKITNFIEKDGQLESSSIINDFRVYILYSGTRNFITRIEGTGDFLGFCILLTNKGMNVNGDACLDSEPLANELKEEFLENYRSPYLLTETFLNFISR